MCRKYDKYSYLSWFPESASILKLFVVAKLSWKKYFKILSGLLFFFFFTFSSILGEVQGKDNKKNKYIPILY